MQTVSHRCWKYDMFFIWYQNTTFTQLLKHKVQDSACALRPQFSNILKQMLQALTLNTCQSALLHSHKLLNWSLKTKSFSMKLWIYLPLSFKKRHLFKHNIHKHSKTFKKAFLLEITGWATALEVNLGQKLMHHFLQQFNWCLLKI